MFQRHSFTGSSYHRRLARRHGHLYFSGYSGYSGYLQPRVKQLACAETGKQSTPHLNQLTDRPTISLECISSEKPDIRHTLRFLSFIQLKFYKSRLTYLVYYVSSTRFGQLGMGPER